MIPLTATWSPWDFLRSSRIYRVDIPKEGRHKLGSMQRYCWHMGDTVESAAYCDGHYFAINCHFDPCLASLCEEFDHSQEIKSGYCRFPTLAKPSVEQTFCLDFIKLAVRLGWSHYMMGCCASPQDYPKDHTPFTIGLILIE